MVLETLDDEENFALWALLDQLLTNSWQGDWLTIDQNLHGARAWNHLDLSDAGPDLDNLLLGLNSPGGHSNWNVPGSVQKEYMLAVIDGVLNSHVVEGADVRWLNTACGWNFVTGKLEGGNLQWGPQSSGREEKPSVTHEAHVL